MKKVFWAVIGVTLVAASVAALGLAQPSATTTGNGPLAVQGPQARTARSRRCPRRCGSGSAG